MNTPQKNLALLIDADNAQLAYTKQIIEFCATYGTFKAKRAYGDWKTLPLSAHVKTISNLGVERVQQNRIGKNATDFGLAMDVALMLDKNEANIYFIVSSDSDFAAVCERIGQKGATVIGIGSKAHNTSELRKICNDFFNIEKIVADQVKSKPKAATPPKPERLIKVATTKPKSAAPPKTSLPSPKPAIQAKPIASKPKTATNTSSKTAVPKPKSASIAEKQPKPLSEVPPPKSNKPTKVVVRAKPSKPINMPMLNLLIKAFKKTPQTDGWVLLTQIKRVLRELDRDFDERFASRKLSTWFEEFPGKFEVDGEQVRMK